MTIVRTLVAGLAPSLSAGALITAAEELPAYGRDWWTQRGTPGAVVRAARAEDVVATLRFAAERGVAVVPRGAGTNIGAGFLPTQESILLDMRPLDRVLRVDAQRREAVVEPGVVNGALQARLAPLGLCFSPDPASRPFSTIGGNIAENAGGPHCLKYGVTVHHVAAMTCVLVGGDVVRLRAEEAGPDLLGLLIGSEGTLGVVTEATVRLRTLPAMTRTLLAVFDRAEDACEAVSATIAAGVIPAALEYFEGEAVAAFEAYAPSGYPADAAALLLIDVDGGVEEVASDLSAVEAQMRHRAREVRRADDEATRTALWRGRLLGAQALVTSGRGYVIGDTTVPRERIPAMQRAVAEIAGRHGLAIPMLGHAGDGNIHPVVLYDKESAAQVAAMQAAVDELVEAALELGGTLTGEHGVGSEKRAQMRRCFTAAEVAAMRAVKGAFDPHGRLNPGVLLPDAAQDEPALPRFAAALDAAVAAQRAGVPWTGAGGDGPVSCGEPEDGAAVDVPQLVLDGENLTATVGAHVPLAELRRELGTRGFSCALPHPGGAGEATTVGALVGGGGSRAAVRDLLLAVRVTLPEGGAARFGSKAVKDVAGYDMKRLYIGSGATFGTLRDITLRVAPDPRA